MSISFKKPNKNCGFEYFKDNEDKISVFVGAYGSGKSEISVNTVLLLAETDPLKTHKMVIADLDIVNPFYRSTDAKESLKQAGVSLITSIFTNTNADVPAIPQEIMSVFDQPKIRAVLDIGGEEAGARVVANLSDKLTKVKHSLYMVINMNRPFTDSADKIRDLVIALTDTCGIMPTGLINNTNLLELTNKEDLLEANRIIGNVSDTTGIPLVFCAGLDIDYPMEWGNRTPDGVLFMRMERFIKYYMQ